MAFSRVLQKFPFLIPSVQTGFLMSGGDIISQIIVEKKNAQTFEWIRPARFFGMGFFFVAPCLRLWYGFLHKNVRGNKRTAAFKKVALDQLLFAPAFLTAFLTVNGFTQRKSFNAIKSQINKDYIDIITVNYMVWPAVQILNFSFVPLHHQVLVVQIFALFWNTYLAWKTNRI